MTSVLFEEWVDKWNGTLKAQNQHVLLWVNNFSSHTLPASITNICMDFFHLTLHLTYSQWMLVNSSASKLITKSFLLHTQLTTMMQESILPRSMTSISLKPCISLILLGPMSGLKSIVTAGQKQKFCHCRILLRQIW